MTAPDRSAASAPGQGAEASYRWLLLGGIWMVYFCFGLVGASLAPLIPTVRADLGITNSTMGAILGTWQLVYVGAAIPCGMLIDRLQPRTILLLGSLSVGVSALMRGVAGDEIMMFAAVALFGLGGPLISVGAPKLAANWFAGDLRGTAVGIYTTAPALGGAAAFALTPTLLLPALGDWHNVMFLYCAITLVAGVVWFAIASHPVAHKPAPKGTKKRTVSLGDIAGILAVPAVPVVLAMSVGVFFVNHGLNNWLPEVLRDRGLSAAQAGSWASITMIAGILGSLVVPRLAVRRRRLLVLGLVFLAMAGSSLLLLYAGGTGMIAALVLVGVARTSATAIVVLLLLELPEISPSNHGLVTGIFFVSAEIGGMLGPLTIGMLAEASGGFNTSLLAITAISALLLVSILPLARLARDPD